MNFFKELIMIKTYCLCFFLCIASFAFAGPYYTGLNLLNHLLNVVESPDLDAALAEAFPDGDRSNEKDWWKVPGFCWTESGQYVAPGDADKVFLTYKGDPPGAGDDNYWSIRSIDWRDRGYIQKVNNDHPEAAWIMIHNEASEDREFS